MKRRIPLLLLAVWASALFSCVKKQSAISIEGAREILARSHCLEDAFEFKGCQCSFEATLILSEGTFELDAHYDDCSSTCLSLVNINLFGDHSAFEAIIVTDEEGNESYSVQKKEGEDWVEASIEEYSYASNFFDLPSFFMGQNYYSISPAIEYVDSLLGNGDPTKSLASYNFYSSGWDDLKAIFRGDNLLFPNFFDEWSPYVENVKEMELNMSGRFLKSAKASFERGGDKGTFECSFDYGDS